MRTVTEKTRTHTVVDKTETAMCDFCETVLKRNYGGRFDTCKLCKRDVCSSHFVWWDQSLCGDSCGDYEPTVCLECNEAAVEPRTQIGALQEQIYAIETAFEQSRKVIAKDADNK